MSNRHPSQAELHQMTINIVASAPTVMPMVQRSNHTGCMLDLQSAHTANEITKPTLLKPFARASSRRAGCGLLL